MIDKKQLRAIVVVIASLISFLVPYLHSAMQPSYTSTAEDVSPLCPHTWMELDGRCLKLFEEPKTWIAAEEECQLYGANLASIRSKIENDAVMAMVMDATPIPSHEHACGLGVHRCADYVWIGLTDTAQEGTFAWSDGEPADFLFWDTINGQPKSDDGKRQWEQEQGLVATCGAAVGQLDYVAMQKLHYSYHAANGKWMVWPGAHSQNCEPALHYFVCSKPAAPMAALGGSMYGCVDGHWVMGQAHSSTDLPPTIVRAEWRFPSISIVPAPYINHLDCLSHVRSIQAAAILNTSEINASLAHTERISNIVVTTAAECQSLVRDRYPEANAAEYSNEGHSWCTAVFNACVRLLCTSACFVRAQQRSDSNSLKWLLL